MREYNITHVRGDSFKRTIRISEGITPKNLTGAILLAQVRPSRALNSLMAFQFTIENRKDTEGEFDLVLYPSDTANLSGTQFVYDLEITIDGFKQTYLHGSFNLVPDVSR